MTSATRIAVSCHASGIESKCKPPLIVAAAWRDCKKRGAAKVSDAEGPHGYSQSRNRRGGAAAGDTHLVSLWRWKRIGQPLVYRRLVTRRRVAKVSER